MSPTHPLEPALWIGSGPVVSVQFAFDDLVVLKKVRMLAVWLKYSVIVNRTTEEKPYCPHLPQTARRRDLPSPSKILDGSAERHTSVHQERRIRRSSFLNFSAGPLTGNNVMRSERAISLTSTGFVT